MVIPGQKLKSMGMVEGLSSDSQVQPAGIDLTVKSVFRFDGAGAVDFDNSRRKLPNTIELPFPANSPLHLHTGPYKVVFNELVKVPPDCIAIALPRSSLLRMGVSAHNAVWDSGYEGRSEGLIYVANPAGVAIHQNAKLVQLVFLRLEGKAETLYSGIYHGENMHENK